MATQRNNNKEGIRLYLKIIAGCIVLASVSSILLMPEVAWAEKGGNGKGKTGDVGGDVSGWIFCRVTFDDSGAVQSDRKGEYVDGVDLAAMAIGRNRNISMDFNTHNKKDSIRTLHFPSGFPTPQWPANNCLPILDNRLTAPTGPDPEITLAAKDAELSIKGEDHDDTPVGCSRAVNAVLTVKDDNGETWFIYFGNNIGGGGTNLRAPCGDDVIVERLSNADFDGDGELNSQWSFSTSGLGYVYRDNRPPHGPTEFWGALSLPFSGTITSLSNEPEPDGSCCDFPDSVNCP